MSLREEMRLAIVEAVLYTRFSPRPNAAESESCEKQEEACRAYCERKGYKVDRVIADREKSGDDAARAGLWTAIEALKPGGVLVVRWRNRLAREVYLSEVIRRAVEKRGARIEAAEESNNGSSPDDVFIQHILAAFAERERKVIAMRTKCAMLKHQRSGRIMSRRIPYGYRADPERPGWMIEDEAEQGVIAIMRQLASEGKCYNAIGVELDRRGLMPREATQWSRVVVKRVLGRTAEGVGT